MDILNITKRFVSSINALEHKGVIRSKSQLAVAMDTHKQSLSDITNGKRNVTPRNGLKNLRSLPCQSSLSFIGHFAYVFIPSGQKIQIQYFICTA